MARMPAAPSFDPHPWPAFFDLDFLSALFRFRALNAVADAHGRLQARLKTSSPGAVRACPHSSVSLDLLDLGVAGIARLCVSLTFRPPVAWCVRVTRQSKR
jgi:hypothetical protein